MGSSIKINSISIDLAGGAKEIDMVKCDHFSIRGYVAEKRERDHNKCWPFREESVILVDQESYSLPSLSVPKFRWWRCMSCIRDINADDGIKDCELHPNSRRISGKIQSKLNSLNIIDQEKERRTGNAVEVNEDVNCKRSRKNDHRATTFLKRVNSKSRKLGSQEHVRRNKRGKHNVGHHQAVTTFGSSEIAGLVEDTPPKAIKNHHKDSLVLMKCDHNGSSESIDLAAMSGLQRRKTRKVRRLSELLDQPETKTSTGGIRKEEPSTSSKRGRKRKVLLPENNYVSRKLITVGATFENNASKSYDSDQDYSTSTDDSRFDRDLLIKGKQKNRRFQVVDEFVPSVVPCEKNDVDVSKSACDPCPLSANQRTEKKLSLSRKKKNKPVVSDTGMKSSTLISFSSQYTGVNLLNNEKRVGSLFESSEGYLRKPFPQKPLNNDHVRSRDVEPNRVGEFGSSSKPNTSGWLMRTGLDSAVDFNNNNTDRLSFQNFNHRNNSSSTQVSDRSSVFQKDGSGADRKGKTVMFQEHHHHAATTKRHDIKDPNTPEDQNDDIPMEIVELLAKNQYERCLPDKEPSQETTHKPKNTLLIDLNETYEDNNNNNTSLRPPKPFDSNARRAEQFPFGKQHNKSLDFFPIISQPFVPSPFGIFPPPPTDQPSSSSIRFFGHTRHWLGNVPTMATQRVLRPCNTCQSVPHQYREAASHPIWSSSMRPPPPQCHHQTPVSFNIDPSRKLGVLSQAPPPSNENSWNLNFGKQKSGPSAELSFGCKHGRPVDASFSSDSSIPALHLLSLMDPRVGPPNTPSDHHQGNTEATKRHFPHAKEGDSSKTTTKQQLPYDYYSKSFPIVGTSSLSFQNAQPPWTHHHHQEKQTKRKDTVQPVYTSSNNDQGRFQLLGASDSMKLPLKYHIMDKEKKQNRKAERCSNASTLLQKNTCGPIVCSVNKNPADFTIAEPGNVYMLSGDSLKVRKRSTHKKKTSLSKELDPPVTENV